MNAVALSGFSSDKVVFLGFLPKKTGKKEADLDMFLGLKGKGVTVVMYESPYRVSKTIKWLSEKLGEETKACVVREISKKFEEVIRGSLKRVRTKTRRKENKRRNCVTGSSLKLG